MDGTVGDRGLRRRRNGFDDFGAADADADADPDPDASDDDGDGRRR
jgi:hypothetical protein